MRNDLPQAGLGDTRFVVALDKFDPRNLFRSTPDQGDLYQSDESNIQEYFRRIQKVDVQCIATDRFLNKSKSEYSPPWLTREIVQNFVDHNSQHPGALDGVRFKEEKGEMGTRFTIEGDWEFADPTGLRALHSEKPTDFETAGGNGIGLKQTAIRFLRDFGVKTFVIQGNGWDVEYQLARKEDILRDWQQKEPARWKDKLPLIRHDWLIAKIRRAPVRKDKCAYIIETDNPETVAALREFPTLGVSNENPFLKNSDYVSPEHGQIKWLGSAGEKGRLFVNGQVMQYRERGAEDDFWSGTEGVSLAFRNVKYRMSIDRPPVTRWDLNTYSYDLISKMSLEDAIKQLKLSENLWPQAAATDSAAAFNVIISRIIDSLVWKDYKKAEYHNLFPEKKYLYGDASLTSNQIAELQNQGYIICPSYFEGLGMPSARSKLSSFEQAVSMKPVSLSTLVEDRIKRAEDKGVVVEYQDLGEIRKIQSASDFFQLLKERLSGDTISFEELSEKKNTFRIRLKDAIPKETLSAELFRRKNDEERLVYFIRGAIFYGLKNGIFQRVFTSQGEYISTYEVFSLDEILAVRNIKSPNDLGTFLEFELDAKDSGILKNILTGEAEVSNVPANQQAVPQVTPSEGQKTEETIQPEKPKSKAKELLERFKAIPVQQPSPPQVEDSHKVIKKTVNDPQKEEKIAKMERELPALRKAVEELDSVSSGEPKDETVQENDPVKKYVEWRESENFYQVARVKAGYITGKHLVEIIDQNTQADKSIASIEVEKKESEMEKEYRRLNKRLEAIANRGKEKEDIVNEFEIVLKPSEQQLAQLARLRAFIEITTGVDFPNDLFVYRGTGSRGINIGTKAIGLHEAMLGVSFTEAQGTFAHETAHNHSLRHDLDFIRALQSLDGTTKEKLLTILEKQSRGEDLTDDEASIVDIQNTWNSLRSQK